MIRLIRPLLIFLVLGLMIFWTNTKYNWIQTLHDKFTNIKTDLLIINTGSKSDTTGVLNNGNIIIFGENIISETGGEVIGDDQTFDILGNLQKYVSGDLVNDSLPISDTGSTVTGNLTNNIIDITGQNIFIITVLQNLPKLTNNNFITGDINKSCKFRDQTVINGNYIIAYRQKYTTRCDFEKRYCDNGQLYGKYIYDTCIYGQMSADDFNNGFSNDLLSGGIVSDNIIGINTSGVSNTGVSNIGLNNNLTLSGKNNTGNDLDSAFLANIALNNSINIIKNINNIKSDYNINLSNTKNKLVDDYDDVKKYIDEFVNNYKNSSSLDENLNTTNDYYIKYPNGTKSFGIKKSLDDRQEKVDKVMSNNRTLAPKSLEQYIALMKPVNNQTGSQGNIISTDVVLQDKSLKTQAKKGCITPRGTNISNSQTIVAYQSPATTFPRICQFELRYCDDGKLGGSFSYQNCEFGQLEYNTVLDTKSYYLYSDNDTTYYTNYIAKPIGAGFYLLNGRNSYPIGISEQGCRISNIYIPNGESQTFYKNSTVNRSNNCTGIVRKCDSGNLLGDSSFGSIHCRQSDPLSCRAPGYNTYIPHGSSKIYYNFINSACFSEYRYCNNGNLGGSYASITSCIR